MGKIEEYKKMVDDEGLRNKVMEAMATCAYEYSNAPEEDQPIIITRWTDNVYALVKTMIIHDSNTKD